MVIEKTPETMPTLTVPYISQKDDETSNRYGRRGCGLTALRMVLSYYGKDLGMEELDQLVVETHAYQPMEGKEEIGGWIHAGMTNIARKVGLRGYRIHYGMLTEQDLINSKAVFEEEGMGEEEFKDFSESFDQARTEGPMSDLYRLIDKGIPVIASMKKSYAKTLASHMIVLMGYGGDELVVNDPWEFGPNYKVSVDEFKKHWTNRVIVISTP